MTEEKVKILLVEDDAMILEMYKSSMEADGYDMITAERGSEVVALAKTQKPKLILLDVILPEIDGFSILQELKEDKETKDIPVLMLTNLGQESDQNKAKELGAVGYFVKAQHTPGDILQKIKELI